MESSLCYLHQSPISVVIHLCIGRYDFKSPNLEWRIEAAGIRLRPVAAGSRVAAILIGNGAGRAACSSPTRIKINRYHWWRAHSMVFPFVGIYLPGTNSFSLRL